MTDSPIITTDLTKCFNGHAAVQDLNLQVRAGEMFGLLGPNGAGKTTTIKMLITLLRPSRGQAWVCGYDTVQQATAVRQRIGYVSQELTVLPYLTGRENLQLHGRLYHLSAAALKTRIEEVATLVDLHPALDRLVRTYSGGMKKKLDIACGFLHRPQLLILDEPSLGLDVPSRRKLWDYISTLKASGLTILLCTNYMDEADHLCDRLAIMDHGSVITLGTPTALKRLVGWEVVHVQPADPDWQKRQGKGIEAALRGLPFVKQLSYSGEGLNIQMLSQAGLIPQLVQVMEQCGLIIQHLSYSRPTLDDVFLQFAGRSMREQQIP